MTEPARLFAVPDDVAEARDEAMERASAHADEAWRMKATEIVQALAATGRVFSSDDLWDELESHDVATHEPRALGVVITAASRAGTITRVGYAPSRRAICHGRPVANWIGTQAVND